MDKTIKKITEAFYGIEPIAGVVDINSYETRFLSSFPENDDQPAYMIFILFNLYFGEINHKFKFNVDWIYHFKYNNNCWMVFGVSDLWGIYGPKDAPQKDLDSVKRKIVSAVTILDNYYKKSSKIAIAADKISLQNLFRYSFHSYSFFIKEAKKVIEEYHTEYEGNPNESGKLAGIDFNEGKKYKEHGVMVSFLAATHKSREMAYNLESISTAATVFFFAMNDTVLDACFALSDRFGISYKDFSKLTWEERIKKFLIIEGQEIAQAYKRIKKIRTEVRNIPIHASPVYMLRTKNGHYIPSSYAHYRRHTMNSRLELFNPRVEELIEVLDTWHEILKTHRNTRFGYQYAESGKLIHLHGDGIDQLKGCVGDSVAFSEVLCKVDPNYR